MLCTHRRGFPSKYSGVLPCPYCEISRIKAELEEANRAASNMEKALAEASKEFEKQLSHYKAGVEVKGFVNEYGDIVPDYPTKLNVDQRVRVLVMKEG